MPEYTWFERCKELRKVSDVPVIFASARTSETDRVTGFDIGGDDYLPKPYSMKELLSRVNALIRRAYGFSEEEKIVTFGSVSVNITARTVSKNGEPVLLSLREKLGDDPAKPAYIKTVYKVGNLLEAKG